jgi:hypothetical protein
LKLKLFIVSALRYTTLPHLCSDPSSSLLFFVAPLSASLKFPLAWLCIWFWGVLLRVFTFAVSSLATFGFFVASKDVGFLICNKKRITTDSFDVYFHLWREGGANWQQEFKLWEEEEEESWTVISRKKNRFPKKAHFSSPIKQSSPPRKSSPSLAPRSVRFGNFHCPLPSTGSRS